MEDDLASNVADVLEIDRDEFQSRVQEEAEFIKEGIDDGVFDNPQGNVGLEIEFYAVTEEAHVPRWTEPAGEEERGSLARVPRRLLEYIGFEKELGLHNAEMSTTPQPLNEYGLETQECEVKSRLEAAREPLQTEGLDLVTDGIWTIPPHGETAREYLTDSVIDDGVAIATNMSESTRYHAMANTNQPANMEISTDYVHLSADTVMPESLITSIQPHYQLPTAMDLPQYFRYAVRIAGPILAVGVNAPFFPPDLYDEDAAPTDILANSMQENRITVFESVLNSENTDKIRFPSDINTVNEAVERIANDPVMVPMPITKGERFDDKFAHFRMKHGTFWRWIRPVFDGPTREAANARIEFRPLPGQPTVQDIIAFQALVAGVLVGLYRQEHPVKHLSWETAKDNFYNAAQNGITADLTWITNAGEETGELDVIFEDILAHAALGLESHGLSEAKANTYLDPIRTRVENRITPAKWKQNEVQKHLDDGKTLEEAIYAMQRNYFDKQKETLITGKFGDWLQ
ncbi:MAG: hypothetical protein ABEI86_10400 [Halobacteriaceae archaeon]